MIRMCQCDTNYKMATPLQSIGQASGVIYIICHVVSEVSVVNEMNLIDHEEPGRGRVVGTLLKWPHDFMDHVNGYFLPSFFVSLVLLSGSLGASINYVTIFELVSQDRVWHERPRKFFCKIKYLTYKKIIITYLKTIN